MDNGELINIIAALVRTLFIDVGTTKVCKIASFSDSRQPKIHGQNMRPVITVPKFGHCLMDTRDVANIIAVLVRALCIDAGITKVSHSIWIADLRSQMENATRDHCTERNECTGT